MANTTEQISILLPNKFNINTKKIYIACVQVYQLQTSFHLGQNSRNFSFPLLNRNEKTLQTFRPDFQSISGEIVHCVDEIEIFTRKGPNPLQMSVPIQLKKKKRKPSPTAYLSPSTAANYHSITYDLLLLPLLPPISFSVFSFPSFSNFL